MQNMFLVPSWFLGYDILFELLFAVVTFSVALYSFKVYNLSNQEKPKIFGIGFLLIAVGYIIQTLVNGLFFFYLRHLIFSPQHAYFILSSYNIAIYGYTYLMLLGLVTLVYMTFNTKNIKIHILLSLLVMMIIVSSVEKLLLFYLMSATIALFIVHHYIRNYVKKKKRTSLLVLSGFAGMLIAYVIFIFSLESEIYYFAAHLVKLIAYSLILLNLIFVVNGDKRQKKKIDIR